MSRLARLDQTYVWHPFTQMQEWMQRVPIVIVRGRGAELEDARGRRYLDANASIWTNLHGHNHPRINRAIRQQLERIAHSSALGLANEPASLLAEKLIKAARLRSPRKPTLPGPKLNRVFFSDDGSTAMETALKLAYEFSRRSNGFRKPRFLSLQGGYHGDTVGAVSLGHIDRFHSTWKGLLFKTDPIMSPYCYRCPFNRARPERADAREYRQCNWECVDEFKRTVVRQEKRGEPYAAFVVEPRMQGAAGMIAHPHGWLKRVVEIVRRRQTLVIADEVLTGFGRIASGVASKGHRRASAAAGGAIPPLASHQEGVQPDLVALAKGLTAGYLPMAATLISQPVFDAFLGDYSEFKTFFHGHSYSGNQLGAAAALENMRLLEQPATHRARQRVETTLRDRLKALWRFPNVGDIRQEGCVAGVELVRNWRTRESFDPRERIGARVAEAMAQRGVLTRPIGDVVVLMPPYCSTITQVRTMVRALARSLVEVVGKD